MQTSIHRIYRHSHNLKFINNINGKILPSHPPLPPHIMEDSASAITDANTSFGIPLSGKPIIPLNVYMTWNSSTEYPPRLIENINNLKIENPEFNFIIFDEKKTREMLIDNFDNEVIDAYDKLLPGAYRSDMFRAAILYLHGGIYLDIKYRMLNGFKLIMLTEDEWFVKDNPLVSVENSIAIAPFIIVSKSKNPVLLDLMRRIIYNTKHENYGPNSLCPTGPCAIGQSYCKFNHNTVFRMTYKDIFCYFDRTKIMTPYDGYRDDLKSQPGFIHYHDAWLLKKIYRTPFVALDTFDTLNGNVKEIKSARNDLSVIQSSIIKLSSGEFLLLRQYSRRDINTYGLIYSGKQDYYFSSTLLSYDFSASSELFYSDIVSNIDNAQLYEYNGVNKIALSNSNSKKLLIANAEPITGPLVTTEFCVDLSMFDSRILSSVLPTPIIFGKTLCFITGWYPIHITYPTDNNLKLIYTNSAVPDWFQNIVSSTPCLTYKGKNWTIVKESYIRRKVDLQTEQQDVYHRIVVLDDLARILRYSQPFKFNKYSRIDTCQGFVILNEDKCLLSYSSNSISYIGEYDFAYLDALANIPGPP